MTSRNRAKRCPRFLVCSPCGVAKPRRRLRFWLFGLAPKADVVRRRREVGKNDNFLGRRPTAPAVSPYPSAVGSILAALNKKSNASASRPRFARETPPKAEGRRSGAPKMQNVRLVQAFLGVDRRGVERSGEARAHLLGPTVCLLYSQKCESVRKNAKNIPLGTAKSGCFWHWHAVCYIKGVRLKWAEWPNVA